MLAAYYNYYIPTYTDDIFLFFIIPLETPEKVGTVGNLITSCAYLSLLETEEEFDVVPESALTIGTPGYRIIKIPLCSSI